MNCVLIALLVAACAPTIRPVTQGSGGYEAFEFARATQVKDHAFNIYTFGAGRKFVGDRYADDGRKLYCGLVTINDDPKPFDACFGFDAPSTIIIGLGTGIKEVARPLPAGTINIVKARY